MKVKLKEIAEVINGSTPSTKEPKYYDGDIVWITPKDLSDQKSKYIYGGERRITKLGYDSCSTKMIPENNILMSSRAPIGLIAINKVECCTNQGFKSLIVDKSKCDVEYLYYYLKLHIKEIEALGSGTTFKEVSKASIEEYEIELPPLEAQKNIASTLSLLDEKIPINNKVITKLESIIKMLYAYWFLQFEFPNEDGKPYKSSGGKMVWNEEMKREIPESWEVRKVKDCLVHINTGLNPRDHFVLNDGEIKYITVKNLTTMGELNFAGCDMISEKTKKIINRRSMISKGDILFASIAPLGRCYMIREDPKEWEINESVFSIRHNDKLSSEYLYQYFMSDYFIKKAEHSSTGSVFAGIRITTLQEMDIVVPTKKVLEHFTKKVSNLYDLKHKISIENQKLAALRDFLLPLLMNGQVTFKENKYGLARICW